MLYGVRFADGEWGNTAAWGACRFCSRFKRCVCLKLSDDLRLAGVPVDAAPTACMCDTITGCASGALLPAQFGTLTRVAVALRLADGPGSSAVFCHYARALMW